MRRAARRTPALLVLLLLGCEGRHLGIPWDFERMVEQPRYDAFGRSAWFPDGAAMQAPPPGTVPQGAAEAAAGGAPPPPDAALLAAGRTRFEAFCAPCHGLDGRADTPVAQAMRLRAPPSLLEERVRARDAASLRRVIHDGFGLMPSYATLIPPGEDWSVAWYVKALQASQEVRLAELPPGLRERARRALGAAP